MIRDTLTELRPEVAADIYDRWRDPDRRRSAVDGIEKYIRNFINLPVIVSEEPRMQRSTAF